MVLFKFLVPKHVDFRLGTQEELKELKCSCVALSHVLALLRVLALFLDWCWDKGIGSKVVQVHTKDALGCASGLQPYWVLQYQELLERQYSFTYGITLGTVAAHSHWRQARATLRTSYCFGFHP